MDKDIFLSFVVPCYNINDYVSRCINSLGNQIIKGDFEIEYILVNDGSTDNTFDLLNRFAEKDSRAKVINQNNRGVSAARNAGLNAASGKYVFFLDGDDYVTEQASQILYESCYNDSADIIITNAFIVEEGFWDNKQNWDVIVDLANGLYSSDVFIHKIKMLPISFKAYKRDMLIKNNVRFDEDLKVGEVYTFFLHALSCSNFVSFVDKRVMNYLVRGNSVMRDGNINRDKSILSTISKIDKYSHLFPFDITNIYSYNSAFLSLVNLFTLDKYIKQTNYNSEIADIISKIKKVPAYKSVLHYFAYKHPRFDSCTRYSIALLISSKIFYILLRYKYKLSLNK